MNQTILSNLDTYINNLCDGKTLAGASLCIIHKGDEVYRKEFGKADIENNIPLKSDAIFRCFSMTKPVTSTAVMTLVEKGKLGLFDPVSQYLPGFKDQKVYTDDGLVPVKSEATIQNLLDMTAGLVYPDMSFPAGRIMQEVVDKYYKDVEAGKRLSTVELANLIGQQPLEFHPGEGWRYSFCADVLGAIVEVVSGIPYSDYLKENIFNPLGMTDTDFFVPEQKLDRLMQVYEPVNETHTLKPCTWQMLALTDMFVSKPAFESGGAGLVSTVDDYGKFVRMLLGRGTYNGTRILGHKTVDYMNSNHLNEKQMVGYNWDSLKGYGYGNLMRQMLAPHENGSLGSAGEFGWDGWLGTYMFVDPVEDLGIIYVIQKCGGNGYRDTQVMRDIIYSAL